MHVKDAGGRILPLLNSIDGGITIYGPASVQLDERCFHITARVVTTTAHEMRSARTVRLTRSSCRTA